MILEIIATESLGVRGMCCLVKAGGQRILIDPGVALGYLRHGLLPHPTQVVVGARIRQEIIKAINSATDAVFSHFHGDHIPLRHANPFQLSLQQVAPALQNLRCWSISSENLSPKMQQRGLDLAVIPGNAMKVAEGCSSGILIFSNAVPHGLPESRAGSIMMTRVESGGQVFVHASDIQLLCAATVDIILNWQPDIVFTSGPPLYLEFLTSSMRKAARENALRLAENVKTLIIDHHLLRSEQGLTWLNDLSEAAGKKIYCAADFMKKTPLLLEARRQELYHENAVPENWHRDYEAGKLPLE
ncbi:MAG: hypothetical protein GQ559_09625 [Desulfobulbaceae bacterium]|nr:hypothetical protein [Desulfobulbaceae bacterium]